MSVKRTGLSNLVHYIQVLARIRFIGVSFIGILLIYTVYEVLRFIKKTKISLCNEGKHARANEETAAAGEGQRKTRIENAPEAMKIHA